jgi:hypothetical protein
VGLRCLTVHVVHARPGVSLVVSACGMRDAHRELSAITDDVTGLLVHVCLLLGMVPRARVVRGGPPSDSKPVAVYANFPPRGAPSTRTWGVGPVTGQPGGPYGQ